MFFFFFFNDTATTEIYTLSLHDALPIFSSPMGSAVKGGRATSFSKSPIPPDFLRTSSVKKASWPTRDSPWSVKDRKSTRLNSSHTVISYAVFCLKKKNRQSGHQ